MPVSFSVERDTLWGFLLTLTRTGSALIFLPMPGFQNIAEPARILLIVGSTFCLFPVWNAAVQANAGLDIVTSILFETSLGLLIGLTIAFLFESFRFGAQLIAFQAGFGFASTIDPQSQADSNILQVMTEMATGLMFFSLGIHGQILRMLGRSFGEFTLTSPAAKASSVALVLILGAKMFVAAVRLALPVVALVFLVDQALAALTRLQTHMQLMTLAFPAKILLTLFFLTVILTRWVGGFERLVTEMFGRMLQLLAA
jgi:flagellar biosynthesis protein FliR